MKPTALAKSLTKLATAAARHEEATQRLGIVCDASPDERNPIAHEVNLARKAYLAALDEVRRYV